MNSVSYKWLALFGLLVFTGILNAQITLTEQHLPRINERFVYQTTQVFPSSWDPTATGVIQWDFSTLNGQRSDTIWFESTEHLSEGKDFRSFPIAQKTRNGSVYLYSFVKNENGQTLIGGLIADLFGQGNTHPYRVDPNGIAIQTPLTYGDQFSEDHFAWNPTPLAHPPTPGIDSFFVASTVHTEFEVDAYGTLKLPGSIQHDVLRVRRTQSRRDSVRFLVTALNQWQTQVQPSSSVQLEFRTKELPVPIAIWYLNPGSQIDSVSYLVDWISSSSTLQAEKENPIRIIPNPATDHIRLQGVEKGEEIFLIHADGKEEKLNLEDELIRIDQLLPGSYWIKVKGDLNKNRVVPFQKIAQ